MNPPFFQPLTRTFPPCSRPDDCYVAKFGISDVLPSDARPYSLIARNDRGAMRYRYILCHRIIFCEGPSINDVRNIFRILDSLPIVIVTLTQPISTNVCMLLGSPLASADAPFTGFLSEIGTKLRDWAVGQAGGSCYSRAALSSNDSKTRYTCLSNKIIVD